MTVEPVPLRNRRRPGSVLPAMSHQTPHRPPVVASFALVLLLAACASAGGSAGASDDGPSDSARPTRTDNPAEPVPSESAPAAVGEVPEALLGQILSNAADQADVDIGEIDVLRAEAVVWNDGSLGCPEPDMMYTQALVDGYHVVVDAGGTELDYRATTSGDYRLCENPGPPSGG